MDYELIFWIMAGVASITAAAVLWGKAKREAANYMEWVVE